MTFGQWWDLKTKENKLNNLKQLWFTVSDYNELRKLLILFEKYSDVDIYNSNECSVYESENNNQVWINKPYWDLDIVIKTYIRQLEDKNIFKWD